MKRMMHTARPMVMASFVVMLIGAACGPVDQRMTQETGSPQGDRASVEASPSEDLSDEHRRSGGPQPRRDEEGSLPPITVETPFTGQEVASPMVVSGTANVFEATVSMKLLDESGSVTVDRFTTATCGTGCRGDYTTRLRFDVDETQSATLQVFESSAEDGRPLHMVSIPVVLVP
jgi:hypothetical protein